MKASFLKRGLIGVYQRVDNKQLDRYLSEFDFRQNKATEDAAATAEFGNLVTVLQAKIFLKTKTKARAATVPHKR